MTHNKYIVPLRKTTLVLWSKRIIMELATVNGVREHRQAMENLSTHVPHSESS